MPTINNYLSVTIFNEATATDVYTGWVKDVENGFETHIKGTGEHSVVEGFMVDYRHEIFLQAMNYTHKHCQQSANTDA